MDSRGTLRRVLAVQGATLIVAEAANVLARHNLTFLHRYWVIRPFLFARYLEHVQYQFLGAEGVSGRAVFAAMVAVLWATGLWFSTQSATEAGTATCSLAGLMLGGLSANGAEIAAFGQVTDFLGVQVPALGSSTMNLADIAIGTGFSGLVALWVRPGWRQSPTRLTLAMTIGVGLTILNPITPLLNPITPPSAVSASVVGVAALSKAQQLWGPGIAVKNAHPVRRCLVVGSDCRSDTRWLWEVDMVRPSDRTRAGQPAARFRRYADYRTGRIL